MGSSKRVKVGYRYYMGEHIACCYGPVDAVTAIDIGERRAWSGNVTDNQSISISQRNLFGGDDREGGVEGTVDVLMGGPTQTQNSYLVAKCSPNVPAYRGVLTMVFRGVNSLRSFCWSAMNPYIKPVEVTVRRILSGWNTAVWYPEKAEIGPPETTTAIVPSNGTWEYVLLNEQVDPGYTNLTPPGFGVTWLSGQAPFKNPGAGGNTDWPSDKVLWVRKTITLPANTSCSVDIFIENGGLVYWNGVKIGELNLDNDISGQEGGVFAIPRVNLSAPETGTLMVKCFNDIVGPTELQITVNADLIVSPDMNPAHIIYQCITDPIWGMGWPTSQIDSASFTAAADALHSEGFGISLEWSQQSKISDFIQSIVDHVGAVFYSHPQTGKFGIKLIRDDYDPELLPAFDESSVLSLNSFQRKAVGETINEITVVYRDKESGKDTSVTVQDLASVQSQGATITQVKQYPGISSAELAQRVAMRDLVAGTATLSKVSINVNRRAWNLFPGDVFKLSWAKLGLSAVIYRVLSVNYGSLTDPKIRVEAVEDVFGLPDNTYVGQQPEGWIDSDQPPAQIDTTYLTELSYYELVQYTDQATRDAYSGQESFVVALAEQPSPANSSLLIYSSATDDTSAYLQIDGLGEYTPTAELDGAIEADDLTAVYTNEKGFAPSVGDYVYIDEEAIEIVSVDTGTKTIGLARAVMDTVPTAHADGAKIWQWSGELGFTSVDTDFTEGETTYVRYVGKSSVGESGLDGAYTDSITHQSRWMLPYPPANVKINASSFPASADAVLAITWVGRNRLQQTAGLIDFFEGNIDPEAGTTYTVRFYNDDNDVLLFTATGIAPGVGGSSQGWDASSSGATRCRVEVSAQRDGLDSWQTFAHAFDVTGGVPFSSVSLLLHMDGTNGSTTFTDNSGTPKTVTANNGAAISTAQSKFGGASGLFDGSNDFLSIAADSAFNMGTGPWTIECWIRPTSKANNYAAIIGSSHATFTGTACSLLLGGTSTTPSGWRNKIVLSHFGQNPILISTTSINLDTWYHVAVTYDGANVRLFVNGNLEQTTASSQTFDFSATSGTRIGRDGWNAGAGHFAGYIDDLRVTKGYCRYTVNFVPPSAPYPNS